MWKVVISSNLNPPLKLFFYSPILTNNNLLLKIYCENIVKILWQYFSIRIFYFYIIFLPFISFLFFFFLFLVFLLHTRHTAPLLFIFFSTSRAFQRFTSERERERERDRLGPPPHASPWPLQPLLQHLPGRSSSSPPIGLGQIGLFFFSFSFSFFFHISCSDSTLF